MFFGFILHLSVRGAIFGFLYVVLGKRIWFFPNINAEETTFRELIRFWPKKDEEEPPKWTSRLTYAVAAVLFILLLRHHAPDEAARARYLFFPTVYFLYQLPILTIIKMLQLFVPTL